MPESERSTRQAILDAAQVEFLEKGYQKAGLRDIAKKAGVTTGALYGYFKNKEEVFSALVKPHYDYMLDTYHRVLHSFHQFPAREQCENMENYTSRFAYEMADYMYAHRDAFKLILCCSEGTPFNDLVHRMAQLDVDATHDFRSTVGEAGIPSAPVNPVLEHMLTSGMFSTFFELIIHDIPREQAREYIDQLLAFYSGGWARIMGMTFGKQPNQPSPCPGDERGDLL